MTAPDSRDTDRDAWLSEALRHAPDASSDAPPSLSETILREARAAVAPAAQPAPFRPAGDHGFLHRIAAAWAWLARPPVAAAFASVMVATLAGLLWWDRPLEGTLPPREPPAAAAPAAAAPAAADMASAERERTRAPLEAAKRAVDQAPAELAKATPAPAIAAGKTEAGAPAAAPARTAEAPGTLRKQAEAAGEYSPAVPAAEPFPAPQAATPAAAAPAPAAARRDADTTAAEMAQLRALTEVAADKSSASARNEQRSVAGAASPALAKGRVAEVRSSPLAGMLQGITQEPERWSWQRVGGSGKPQPMNPALQRWLAQFERVTTSRWRPARDPAPTEATPGLRLLHDGLPHATLNLSAEAARVEQHGTASASALPPVTAPIPAASVEALARALDEAAP